MNLPWWNSASSTAYLVSSSTHSLAETQFRNNPKNKSEQYIPNIDIFFDNVRPGQVDFLDWNIELDISLWVNFGMTHIF